MISRPPLRGLVPLIVLLLAWQFLGDPKSAYFPRPSAWWDAAKAMFGQGVLGPALFATVSILLICIVLVMVVGSVLGAALGRMPKLDRLLAPTIEVLRTMPPPVVVPIVVLAIGATPASAVVIATFGTMWVVVLNVSSAARAIPNTRFEAARSLGLTRAAIARKVLLPSLVPGISLSLRVVAPIVLIVILLTEMLTALSGLGRLLLQAQQNFAVARMLAVLAIVGLLGYLLNLVVSKLQESVVGAWE